MADADRRYGASSIGTAAEESRKVAEELRIGRMVEAARSSGNPKGQTADLAERADRAFASGDHYEAMVLARAAAELGSTHVLVPEIIASVQADRDLADRQGAKALRDRQDVGVVVAAFDRDVLAATSHALQDSARLARAIGDGAGEIAARKEAAEFSISAKMEAYAGAQAFGDGVYQEPVVIASGRPDDLQAVPDGARLP